ncbi:hypothetical protein JRQ81_012219 [Phrynocephalus forsythii]|uniref:DDE Tnp4 domain-containing protein n=1 Tax=Phrynocephalus forsythii TaxID=171643 RepID=A0A9Q0X613_9SAUR|nr:hypothetical protein JRQ81_012219 [Phrynocephalus forsythii]
MMHMFSSLPYFSRECSRVHLFLETLCSGYAGVSIPPLILGNGAYPLCKWLMKPYDVPKNEVEKHYNKIFNRSRNIVERAFGRLKARFRRLSVRMEAHIQNVNSIIASAVILHNICERKNHEILDDDTNLKTQ